MHTATGLKAIEQIEVGEQVMAYDHWQLRWAQREVVEVNDLLHQGTMARLQVKAETLRGTGGHLFWVVSGEDLQQRPAPGQISSSEVGGRQEGRWVLARDLRAGDAVLLRHGEVVALESVRLDVVQERVYNFHVHELQNYAIGVCGVLVHNTNDPVDAPRPGVGGNGAASELPNLSGKSPADAVKAVEDAGFTPKNPTPSAGGWQTFKHPDGSQVDIHFPSGRVVRTAAPRYGPDGSRINRGQRLGPDGAEIPRDLPHDQHPPETLGSD